MLFQILLAMRPRQWVKNFFVLPALIFSKHLFEWDYLNRSVAGVLCFCLLSGAIYLFNDLFDLEQDRLHPDKSKRPIAVGLIPVPVALVAAGVLLVLGLGSAFLLQVYFGYVAVMYAGLNLAYSYRLKHVVLVDVLIVAFGFLLRPVGGALVIEVEISTWFILCSFMLALFLAVAKRRQELVIMEESAGEHRAILAEYSVPFLDQIISVLTSATLVCYALYAMGVGEGVGASRHMQWTIPFVLYGILRYLYVVYRQGGGDNPTAVVWKDRPLQINMVLWIAVSMLGLYLGP